VVYATAIDGDDTRALDATNGDELWSSDLNGFDLKVTDEWVLFLGEGGVAVLSRTDGTLERMLAENETPRSYVAGDESAYVGSDQSVRSVSLDDGSTEWEQTFDYNRTKKVVATDDTVYV
jgi:outer membrane protein assembly factor BamB